MNSLDVSISKYAQLETVRSQIAALADRLASEWWTAQCNNNFAHFHLYYRASKPGRIGQLIVAEEAPEDFELAESRRLSPAWTREIARTVIHDAMRRLPILMHEEEPFPAHRGKPYTFVRLSKIDTPVQGMLYSARTSKKKWWKVVKGLRQKIKDNPLHNHRFRLDLIEAESRWHEAQHSERAALKAIEKRANELGLTTIRPKKGATNGQNNIT